MSKFCQFCGSEISDSASFCHNCGAKLTANKAEPNNQNKTEPQGEKPFVVFNTTNEQQTVQRNTLQNSKKSKNTGVFIAATICLVLAAVFVALYFVQYTDLMRDITDTTPGLFFLTFILYMFVFGWFSFIPALGLAIASLCCSVKGMKSTSKTIKVFSIIFLVLSILIIVAIFLSAMIPSFIGYGAE